MGTTDKRTDLSEFTLRASSVFCSNESPASWKPADVAPQPFVNRFNFYVSTFPKGTYLGGPRIAQHPSLPLHLQSCEVHNQLQRSATP